MLKALGFTAAAALLHSTQSTVSQKIRRLEDLVGHRLLDRSGREILPTDAGQALLVVDGKPREAQLRAQRPVRAAPTSREATNLLREIEQSLRT